MANMKPKKTRAIPAKVAKPYKVQMLRNAIGHDAFKTEAEAKANLLRRVEALRPWARRYNQASLKIIDETKGQIGSIIFEREAQELDVVFDDHTGIRIYAKYWRT